VASAVVHRLAQPTFIGRNQVTISGSVGIASATDDRWNGEELLRQADLALYAAKKAGRNCWRVFHEDLKIIEAA
jgi:diguanylate cyclase (GGDEF)-like protein